MRKTSSFAKLLSFHCGHIVQIHYKNAALKHLFGPLETLVSTGASKKDVASEELLLEACA